MNLGKDVLPMQYPVAPKVVTPSFLSTSMIVEGGSGVGFCVVNEPFLEVVGFLLVVMMSVRGDMEGEGGYVQRDP
jgi:hypothetical protein